MGLLAEELRKKAREKVTDAYNAGVRARNRMVAKRRVHRQREAELKIRLGEVERGSYERERYRMAIKKGKSKAHKGGGGGIGGTLLNIGKGFSEVSDEFVGDVTGFRKRHAATKKRQTRKSGTTITVNGTTIRVSKQKAKKKPKKKKKKPEYDFWGF